MAVPRPRRFDRSPDHGVCVHVRKIPSEAWIVTLNHADEPYALYAHYEDALRAAKQYVAAHPGAVLHDRVRPLRARP
ncbi:MAG: hypothetical protein JHC95_01720 [Solirubrobacteraceae bacterium]|nr:hypothetical protein [Solirubrobacteraceae bacterium]